MGQSLVTTVLPANPGRLLDVVLMSGQQCRRWASLGLTSIFPAYNMSPAYPAEPRHRPSVVPLLAHRLRRRPNSGPTLGQHVVSVGYLLYGCGIFTSSLDGFKCHVEHKLYT